MATVQDNLNTIKTNLVLLVAAETAYQVANGPKPTYSLDGESYDFPTWMEKIVGPNGKIEMINKLIQQEDGAFEVRSFGQL